MKFNKPQNFFFKKINNKFTGQIFSQKFPILSLAGHKGGPVKLTDFLGSVDGYVLDADVDNPEVGQTAFVFFNVWPSEFFIKKREKENMED
jgi:hypothetical protein